MDLVVHAADAAISQLVWVLLVGALQGAAVLGMLTARLLHFHGRWSPATRIVLILSVLAAAVGGQLVARHLEGLHLIAAMAVVTAGGSCVARETVDSWDGAQHIVRLVPGILERVGPAALSAAIACASGLLPALVANLVTPPR